jgi:hypothetical protein
MMEFFLGSFNNFLQHFERLAVFRKWGILNLSDDSLVYRIISSLNGLSSLKTLSLARNYFERWNKWKLLSIISNLFLILDYVHFFIISYKYVRGLTIPMRQWVLVAIVSWRCIMHLNLSLNTYDYEVMLSKSLLCISS